jgi:phosphoribosylformimino-5-aminoimidazole carboxamide ribotide isomerase
LRQGDYAAVTVYDPSPETRAAAWRGKVPWLHVVDLEGAKAGHAVQVDAVRRIVDAFGEGVQVGGGIRTRQAFEEYRALGASRIVLGSAAIADPTLVRTLATEHPNVVVLAVDARDGRVATDGWTKTSSLEVTAVLEGFRDLPLAGVLYTDIARDGTGTGPNVTATVALAERISHPVIASGGIGSLSDLQALAASGTLWGTVVGSALYTGAFSLDEALAAVAVTAGAGAP